MHAHIRAQADATALNYGYKIDSELCAGESMHFDLLCVYTYDERKVRLLALYHNSIRILYVTMLRNVVIRLFRATSTVHRHQRNFISKRIYIAIEVVFFNYRKLLIIQTWI